MNPTSDSGTKPFLKTKQSSFGILHGIILENSNMFRNIFDFFAKTMQWTTVGAAQSSNQVQIVETLNSS